MIILIKLIIIKRGNEKPTGNHILGRISKDNKMEHRLTKAYTPMANGMIEEFNRRIQGNILDKFKLYSVDELVKIIIQYVYEYNLFIKQKKLDYKMPIFFFGGKE